MKAFLKQFEIKENQLNADREEMNNKFKDFKRRATHELEVKDVIIERYIKYADVLKVELAYAKNVIKNPLTFQKVFEHMNY